MFGLCGWSQREIDAYIVYFQRIIEKFLNVIKLHGMITESNESKYPKQGR